MSLNNAKDESVNCRHKRLRILAVAIFGTFCVYGQEPDNVATLVKAIAEVNRVDCKGVGITFSPSEQFKKFEKLVSLASRSELIKLTDHPNAAVRCYSFEALTQKDSVDIFSILIRHLNDSVKVDTYCACIEVPRYVGDYFIHAATNAYERHLLTKSQQERLDSLLIFQDGVFLLHRHLLLQDIKPEQRYYQRVRQLAIRGNNPVMALALARYNNSQDIDIIKGFFKGKEDEYYRNAYYAVFAVREFPDDSFYPILVKLFKKEWRKKRYDYSLWRILYQALAKFPNQDTYELFERTVKTKDDFRRQKLGVYLTIAIKKYPNPIFDSLRSRIKLDENSTREVDEEFNEDK